jgi:hypothetical protein
MKDISYFKKPSLFGKYDLPIPLKDAMGRDPEFKMGSMLPGR